MLIPKNNANQMRTRILIKIAESYFADKFKNADRIPLELRPKEQQPSRCCIYKDRAVLKYRCMSSLGFSPERKKTDELKTLAQYGEEALERTHPEKGAALRHRRCLFRLHQGAVHGYQRLPRLLRASLPDELPQGSHFLCPTAAPISTRTMRQLRKMP